MQAFDGMLIVYKLVIVHFEAKQNKMFLLTISSKIGCYVHLSSLRRPSIDLRHDLVPML